MYESQYNGHMNENMQHPFITDGNLPYNSKSSRYNFKEDDYHKVTFNSGIHCNVFKAIDSNQ